MACRQVEVTRLDSWEGQRPGTRIVMISAPGRVERSFVVQVDVASF